MATPFSPALQVDFVFVRNTDRSTQNLNAFIFGPAASVVRWDEADLKEDGLLGNYDATGTLIEGKNQTSYSYEGRPLGGILDSDYTKLHVENGLLSYWSDASASFYIESRNKIVHDTKGFVTNGAFAADSDFGDREVKVGDRIIVKGVDSNTDAFEVATYVLDIEGILSASSIGSPVAASSNQATIALDDATVTPGGSNTTANITVTGDASGYDGLATGHVTESYTLEVIQGSTGGDPTTARLKVTSASGLDDVASVQPGADNVAFAVGARGLTVTFDQSVGDEEIILGDTWTVAVEQAYTAPTVATSGSYDATDETDRSYLLEVITGGELTATPVVQVSALLGNDVSEQTVITEVSSGVSNTFDLGSHGISVNFNASTTGLRKGDKWTIAATASKPERMGKLVLGNNLPDTVLTGSGNQVASAVEVELFMVTDMEISREGLIPGDVNWEARNEEFLVSGGIQVKTPLWTVNGVQTALSLKKPSSFSSNFSKLYATYRFWHPSGGGIQSLESELTVSELIDGTEHRDNPLYMATTKAAINAGGAVIHTYSIGDPSEIDNCSAALSASSNRLDTYGLVPLSTDPDVLDAVASHVSQMNGPLVNKYRVMWLTGSIPSTTVVVSENSSDDSLPVLATIKDNPDQSGTQYTYVELTSTNAGFLEAGVRAGDKLAIGFTTDVFGDVTYNEYTIDRVINEASLLLASGPSSSEAVGRKIEVHRVLTAAEKVEAVRDGVEPYSLASGESASAVDVARYVGYRFRYLPMATVRDGAYDVPSYYMAAALAGLRSSAAPHQPLTRLAVSGFTSVPELDGFGKTELDLMASYGAFLVTRNDVTAELLIRHAVTCGDFDDVNQREESVISTLHSSTFTLVNLLEPLVGKANVTDSLLALVRVELENAGSRLRSANFSPELGGQIVDFTVLSVRPSPLYADGLVVEVEFELPARPTEFKPRFSLPTRISNQLVTSSEFKHS